MDFKVDKQKALELAKEIGLDVSFDSKNPDVIIDLLEHKDFNNFFSELKSHELTYLVFL